MPSRKNFPEPTGARAPTLNPDPESQRTVDRHKMRPLYERSVEAIADMLDSENENIKMQAAKFVIDQIVGKATQQIKNEHTTTETALVLAEAMKEIIHHLPSPDQIKELSPSETLIEGDDGVFRVPEGDT